MDSSSSKESASQNFGTEVVEINKVSVLENDDEEHEKTSKIDSKEGNTQVSDCHDKILKDDTSGEETLTNTDEIKGASGGKDLEEDKAVTLGIFNEGNTVAINESAAIEVDRNVGLETKVIEASGKEDLTEASFLGESENDPQNPEENIVDIEESIEERPENAINKNSNDQSQSLKGDIQADAHSAPQPEIANQNIDLDVLIDQDESMEDIQAGCHAMSEDNGQDKSGLNEDVSKDKSDDKIDGQEETERGARDGEDESEANIDQGVRSEDLKPIQEIEPKDFEYDKKDESEVDECSQGKNSEENKSSPAKSEVSQVDLLCESEEKKEGTVDGSSDDSNTHSLTVKLEENQDELPMVLKGDKIDKPKETQDDKMDGLVEELDHDNTDNLESVIGKTYLDELEEDNEDFDHENNVGVSDYSSVGVSKKNVNHLVEYGVVYEEGEEDGRVYALRKGLNTQSCIYFNWKDICEQIEGCPDAEYEVYDDLNLAVAYILDCDDDDNIPLSALKKRKSSSIDSFTTPKSKNAWRSITKKTTDKAITNKSTPSDQSTSRRSLGKNSKSANEEDLVPVYGKEKQKISKKDKQNKKAKSTNSAKSAKSAKSISSKATRLTKKSGKSTEKSIVAKKTQAAKARIIQKMDEKASAREKKANDRLNKIKLETEKMEREAEWEIMFAALKKYHAEIGNTNIPNSKTSQLGTWVHKQKIEFKKLTNGKASKLTEEKVTMLKSLGFQFHDRTKYASWDDHLESYNEFIMKYGPNFQPLSDTPLGKWLYTVRKNNKELQAGNNVPNLTPERIKKLEDINFEWERPKNCKTIGIKEKKSKEKEPKVSTKDKKWKLRYEELLKYKEEHGNIVVPLNYGPLGRWVSNQRKYYKIAKSGQEQTYLTDERMQLLDDIEFGIKVKRGRKSPKGLSECSQEKKRIESLDWEAMYLELKAFHSVHGNCCVPFRPTTKLRTWVVSQRKEYKKLREGDDSFMTASRIQKLNDLGFNFQTKPVLTWDQRFTKLIDFKQRFGHIQVPRQYEGLGKWISEQRLKYRYLQEGKPTNLTREQVGKLNGLGMVWQVIKQPPAHQRADKKPWAVRFQELLEFKERHGHTVVPQHYPELGSWVQVQRNHYKLMKQGRKSLMTMEKALKLADVGFVFEVKPRKKKVIRQSLGNPYPNLPPVDANSFIKPDKAL